MTSYALNQTFFQGHSTFSKSYLHVQAVLCFSFELLFYKYRNKVKGFVAKLSPSRIATDDIVQEVFVKVWIKKESINPEKDFQSYLFSIAKNLVLDQLKSSVNRRLYFVDDLFQKDFLIEDVSDNTLAIEHEERLMKILDQIPERRREIFCLNKFEGLTYKQVAERLGISENTVDSQIRNALDYLRKEFKSKMMLLFMHFFK